MNRVLALVEGQTEKKFVKEIMAPSLSVRNIFLSARLVGKPGHKGGARDYHSIRKEIAALLRQDTSVCCTTMFDYYGLPRTWPGRADASGLPLRQIPKRIEAAVSEDIMLTMGKSFDRRRFIPYIQMHEFEALLFSNPEVLAETIRLPALSAKLRSIAEESGSPEGIDDNPETAPSKRILTLFSGYQKVLHGNISAQWTGLTTMRTKCPHFNEWVTKLESLVHYKQNH